MAKQLDNADPFELGTLVIFYLQTDITMQRKMTMNDFKSLNLFDQDIDIYDITNYYVNANLVYVVKHMPIK